MENQTMYSRFLAGEQEALTQMMEHFGDPLTLYLYGYTRDFGEAEDLMIEVFSYLVVKKPKVQENALKAYLYKAARNMALRSVAKRNKVFLIALDPDALMSDEKTWVDAVVDTAEKHRVLHLCMEALIPDYREAIYLVYFENMSHKQAAHVMGKREKQVADLIYRAKKTLKTKLEQEGITHA